MEEDKTILNDEYLNPSRRSLKINLTYPNSLEYEYRSEVEIIDFDEECRKDLESGNGFLISAPKATNKKDMKNPDGIYSPKFGQKMGVAI